MWEKKQVRFLQALRKHRQGIRQAQKENGLICFAIRQQDHHAAHGDKNDGHKAMYRSAGRDHQTPTVLR